MKGLEGGEDRFPLLPLDFKVSLLGSRFLGRVELEKEFQKSTLKAHHPLGASVTYLHPHTASYELGVH